MATIDVRNGDPDVDKIQFADDMTNDNYVLPAYIEKRHDSYGVGVLDEDHELYTNCDGTQFRIVNKAHGRNMIKAIEKAIELGWLK